MSYKLSQLFILQFLKETAELVPFWLLGPQPTGLGPTLITYIRNEIESKVSSPQIRTYIIRTLETWPQQICYTSTEKRKKKKQTNKKKWHDENAKPVRVYRVKCATTKLKKLANNGAAGTNIGPGRVTSRTNLQQSRGGSPPLQGARFPLNPKLNRIGVLSVIF